MVLRRRRSAFTLVELTIVIAIIAILAALVIPRFSAASDESAETAIEVNLVQIQRAVSREFAINGVYPAAIDPAWFVGRELPVHAFATDAQQGVEVWSGSTAQTHPANKFLNAGTQAWWYNADNGTVRARIKVTADPAEAVASYNRANGTDITATGDLN